MVQWRNVNALRCSARGLSGRQTPGGMEFNSGPRRLVGAYRSTKCIFMPQCWHAKGACATP